MAVARRGSPVAGRWGGIVKLELDDDIAMDGTPSLAVDAAGGSASAIAVHEEDAVSLAGCAIARRAFPDLGFSDPSAEQIVAELDLDPRCFDKRRLRSSMVRTMVVDTLVREFFERNPTGLAVALFPGLCTRFSRVDNGALRWLELESAEVSAFKSELFRTPERHVIAQCCSIACGGWMKLLADADDMPVLLVAQGGVRRAPPELRDRFLMNAAVHLPKGTELVIEYDANAPIRSSPTHGERASLSALEASGEWAIYPRIRYVPTADHSLRLEHDLAGMNAVSTLFRGRGAPSVAHLRFV